VLVLASNTPLYSSYHNFCQQDNINKVVK